MGEKVERELEEEMVDTIVRHVVIEVAFEYDEVSDKFFLYSDTTAGVPLYLYESKNQAHEKKRRLTRDRLKGTELMAYLTEDESYTDWLDNLTEVFGEDYEDDGELSIPNTSSEEQLDKVIALLGEDFFYYVHTLEQED